MTRLVVILCLSCLGLWVAGCGGNAANTATGPATDGKAATAAATDSPEVADAEAELSVQPNSPPDQVIAAFLEARRKGDAKVTAALLTSRARSETASHKIDVNSQAVPDLEFQVAKPKYLKDNPNGSHVSSIWTELLPDGSKVSYEIVWVLRREEVGWRVAGFAAELIPGTEPQFLDFEDPKDMIRKQEEAIAAAQAADAASLNQSVETPEQAIVPPNEGVPLRNR